MPQCQKLVAPPGGKTRAAAWRPCRRTAEPAPITDPTGVDRRFCAVHRRQLAQAMAQAAAAQSSTARPCPLCKAPADPAGPGYPYCSQACRRAVIEGRY